MGESIICIYHSRDLDGWVSAAIVKNRFPQAKLIGWDYGQPIPEIEEGVEVIMVDVSFPMEEMERIAKESGWRLTWIDHHKSAIKSFSEFTGDGESFCVSSLDNNYAACELTWDFFFQNEGMPEGVRLLGRYDCFGHIGTPEEGRVKLFQYAARGLATNPQEAAQFLRMSEHEVEMTILNGKIIYDYLKVDACETYKKAFPVSIDNHNGLATVGGRLNPKNFNIDFHKDGYEFFGSFNFDGENWTVSLYSENIDVSEICKNHGGGGHAGAAGFVTKTFPFWDEGD